jgi:hypothetical protein
MLVPDLYPNAAQGIHRIQYGENLRLDNAVIHVPAVSPVLYYTGFSQHDEVLGDIRLAAFKHGFHMANTLLAVTQNLQDG